ncbi:sigma 54-interacting transcriptional regulator [Winogradskyella sp. PAMC22761]|nr:sigma 54-interacting transcriptional regulator [Winogradskyella sp. PAMC22761]
MKTTYITWHYTTHGVAYLKHILSCFFKKGHTPQNLHFDELNQMELNTVFDTPQEQEGFVFDKVIYLIAPQKSFDKLSSRRFSYKKNIVHDETIIDLGLSHIYDEITSNDDLCYNLSEELRFVKEKYPDKYDAFKKSIWKNIQHYPVLEQLKWLKEHSNFNNVYKDKLEIIELDVNDLRDEKHIANKVNAWLKNKSKELKGAENIINVSLGSNETQVVWHILAEAEQLPPNTRFIKTYDDKSSDKEKRFKPFSIKEIPTNLITSIGDGFSLFSETKSPSRKLVDKKMEVFLKSGFSILLLGERGIGKSHIAEKAKSTLTNQNNLIQANCASFDNDNTAEAELFGYSKGAFTGSLPGGKNGLIEEANKGVLFLDEIHHLSKLVQAKLMKALQTDRDNKMSIRKMGDSKETKVECRLIFATNKTIKELRQLLLPDFYDRIVQHVVNIPALRETKEDRMADWEKIWKGLKFPGAYNIPQDDNLNKWIKTLDLPGNYRDLQKIAMYYNAYLNFDEETRTMLNEKTPFSYSKKEFTKYHTVNTELEHEKYNFNTKQTTQEMKADYFFELQKWAVDKFKGRKNAIEHFKSKGDTVTDNTFNKWKNKYSLK